GHGYLSRHPIGTQLAAAPSTSSTKLRDGHGEVGFDALVAGSLTGALVGPRGMIERSRRAQRVRSGSTATPIRRRVVPGFASAAETLVRFAGDIETELAWLAAAFDTPGATVSPIGRRRLAAAQNAALRSWQLLSDYPEVRRSTSLDGAPERPLTPESAAEHERAWRAFERSVRSRLEKLNAVIEEDGPP
ncbi:MAG: hypothetical protein AAF235_02885, partial [Planctomycetota bacterium]